jgi:hypothetical protein
MPEARTNKQSKSSGKCYNKKAKHCLGPSTLKNELTLGESGDRILEEPLKH